MTIGVVIHSDSTVSGHGPGVTTLLTGETRHLVPLRDPRANLAEILGIRRLLPARPYTPLPQKDRAWVVGAPPRARQIPRMPDTARSGVRRQPPRRRVTPG
jgi:hypothetical protein